jgi:hypothetical protein
MEPAGQKADLARRDFLCNVIAGTAVGLAGATLIGARSASAQSTLTPDAALKALMDGNQRYVGGQLRSLDEDLSILKANTAEKQEPFAAVLSCADSRVPVEFVFDQSIGQLFVVGLRKDRVDQGLRNAVTTWHFGSVAFTTQTAVGVNAVRAIADDVQGMVTDASTRGVGFLVAANQEGGRIQVAGFGSRAPTGQPGLGSLPGGTGAVGGDGGSTSCTTVHMGDIDALSEAGCFLRELHAGGEAEFVVDMGEVSLHGAW